MLPLSTPDECLIVLFPIVLRDGQKEGKNGVDDESLYSLEVFLRSAVEQSIEENSQPL